MAWNLRPGLWFTDTTPTGGDFGAHVWAPAYLQEHLLPHLRLTGWTHDWYAGFPAFRFYMIITSLAVVSLNTGFGLGTTTWALVASVAASITAIWFFWRGHDQRLSVRLSACAVGGIAAAVVSVLIFDTDEARLAAALLLWPTAVGVAIHRLSRTWPVALRATSVTIGVLLAVLAVPMPYGVSLKLMLVVGSIAMPVAAWAMAKLAGTSDEAAGLASIGVCLFLFDSSFNIYGGNLLSTMAGEYAYSLAVTLALLFVGVTAKGLRTGRHAFLSGLLLALVGLTHVFVAFFSLAVLAALIIVGPSTLVAWKARLRWTAITGCFAAGLSLWWVLPFWWHRGLLTNMGWGKDTRFLSALWSRTEFDYNFLANFPTLQIFVVIAIASTVFLLLRRSRLGLALALTGIAAAAVFIFLPETRLWNTRLLPFYYLAVYLVAAIGMGEMIAFGRSVGQHRSLRLLERTSIADQRFKLIRGIAATTLVCGLATAAIISIGLPTRSLPGGLYDHHSGVYKWGPLGTNTTHLAPGWTEYNLAGYEALPETTVSGGWPEYRSIVAGMSHIGTTIGCGQAMWEYEDQRLGGYGTPLALMLLPHWTNRCIGSFEGLYYESSATTPYHFLTAAEVSARPSNPQRGLPYSGLDLETGTDHMQLLGIRYYMAFSQEALEQARRVLDLNEVGSISDTPWVVFEVSDSQSVVGLNRLPVVVKDWDTSETGWLILSASAFLANDDQPLLLAADGPENWPRAEVPEYHVENGETGLNARSDQIHQLQYSISESMPHIPTNPVTVTDIQKTAHSITFTVDQIGKPVLVKTSYFPNWEASGANGPWRVSPNFMVVIPTNRQVNLYYGRGGIETSAVILGVVLIVAATVVLRRSRLCQP